MATTNRNAMVFGTRGRGGGGGQSSIGMLRGGAPRATTFPNKSTSIGRVAYGGIPTVHKFRQPVNLDAQTTNTNTKFIG